LIQERTKAGLAAARARGCNGGRPKVSSDEARVVLAKKLHADKSLEIDDICSTLRISRSTFYRYVRL
jgi:DNA invertase Pin-like site-specific DNA recombinase